MAEVEIPDPNEVHEKAENPFTKKVALCVAIFAVFLAIAAAGGNNAGKDMIMEQQKASNAWARYQAKVIREAISLNEAEKLEFEISYGGLTGDPLSRKQEMLKRIKTKLAEYAKDKEEITKEAKGHEAARDDSHRRDPYFDFAEVLLQIGIVLASVSMLSGKKWAFYLSLVLAIAGAGLTLNGYFMFDEGKMLASGHAAEKH